VELGKIRTFSGKSLTMGVYGELEARGIQPDGQEHWEKNKGQWEIGD
jgi:hypothetical protein